jgi:hypothetical protein
VITVGAGVDAFDKRPESNGSVGEGTCGPGAGAGAGLGAGFGAN